MRSVPLQIRGIDTDKRTAGFIAATETAVDMGWGLRESLRMDGLDLTRFEKNPVLLDSHNMWEASAVIGEAPVRVKDGLLLAEARFAETDRADDIWRLVRDGFLRTVSIGYDVRKHLELAEGAEDGDIRGPAVIATDWELFEVSMVPIPADEDAVRRSYYQARGFGDVRGRRRAVIDWGKVAERAKTNKGAKMSGKKKSKAKTAGKRSAHEDDDDEKDKENRSEHNALADLLVEQVAGVVTDDNPREDVIAMLAAAAEMEADDVEAVLAGEVEPDGDALKAFASVLPVTLAQLEAAQADEGDDEEDEADEEDDDADAEAESGADPSSRSKKEIASEARAREIRAMAPRGLEEEADALILEGVTVKKARAFLLKAHADARKPVGTDEPGTLKTKTKGDKEKDGGAAKVSDADSFLAGFKDN